MIVIVTVRNDLHSLVVRQRVRELGFRNCHIVECDQIGQGANINYSFGSVCGNDWVISSEGLKISVSQADVVWLRRPRANQKLKQPLVNSDDYKLLNNDCRGAFSGYLSTHFRGKWISDPIATVQASDKIYQQEVARACGFRVPNTIVTQCPEEVRRFFDRCDGNVIVKTIVGTDQAHLETRKLSHPTAYADEAYRLAPTLYQECIEGTQHLRLLSFGEHSLCGLIQTQQLDWRMHLDDSITAWDVPEDIGQRVRRVLEHLGLAMGVVDIKITPDGELVWLEVNPQGQFVFMEPVTGIPFTDAFSRYLIEEVTARV